MLSNMSIRNSLSFDSSKLHVGLQFYLYLSLLTGLSTSKEVSSFISFAVLQGEITCLYTHFAELRIPGMNLFVLCICTHEVLPGPLFSPEVGVGWHFCVCCNKIFWRTYHRLPILFFIYILHHTLLGCEACVIFEGSFLSHRA